MSLNDKVLWSEGLFLQPQHFQQQERYLENFICAKYQMLPYAWGFFAVKIDTALLNIGKVGLLSASGLFPDGTPFHLTEANQLPAPLDLPKGQQNFKIFLALPIQKAGGLQLSQSVQDTLHRYRLAEQTVPDVVTGVQNQIEMQIARVNVSLKLETESTEHYTTLGVLSVAECGANGEVRLQDDYVPPMLDCHSCLQLSSLLEEVLGMVSSRVQVLSEHQAGVAAHAAEFRDFMMALSLSRILPVLQHLSRMKPLHPELLYRTLIGLAGELGIFAREGTAVKGFNEVVYCHDDLESSFAPVMMLLRESLARIFVPTAEELSIDAPVHGVRRVLMPDRAMYPCDFVLAVKASLPNEKLSTDFLNQSRVGSIENIRDLLKWGVKGIPLIQLPVVPREIPLHQGYVYFQLDRQSSYWPDAKTSSGFAIHCVGDMPNLELEFWVIRRTS